MSDRSYAQLTVYACPPEQRPAALAAIEEAFGSLHLNECPQIDNNPGAEGEAAYAPGRWTPAAELVLGDRYGEDDMGLDFNNEAAAALIEAAPGATFAVWVDPKYEYDGALTMYAPELGRFDGSCNADGQPTITAYEVRRLITSGATDRAIVAGIRALLGLPWEQRIAELAAELYKPAA